MKLGVIDVGTNSCRMLMVETEKGHIIKEIKREQIITRLGAGVDQNRVLQQQAVKRTVQAIKEFSNDMDNYQLAGFKIVGTSALRDVKNAELLKKQVFEITGKKIQVISGEEEARYIYQGVSLALAAGDYLIIDIGGGSTEFIWSTGSDVCCRSLDIGAVRMTERKINDPANTPTKEELLAVRKEVEIVLKQELPLSNLRQQSLSLVGVGGTITTLAAIDLQLEKYGVDKIEGYIMNKEIVNRQIASLAKLDAVSRRGITGLQAGREDIIIAGALILSTIMEVLNQEWLRVSEHDILYGMIRELMADNNT